MNATVGADLEYCKPLTIAELRTAAKSLVDDMFGFAELKYEELKQLIDTPLRRAFELADNDRNQRLSVDEAMAASRLLAQTIGILHATGTPANQPNSGTGGPHQRGGT